MSVNVNYCDTFLNALSNNYTSGDYIHTLGFASVGDGGAAMYKVSSDVPSDDVLSDAKSCTVASTPFNYADGNFYTSNSNFFQLIPHHGKVYVEQFGVLPGETVCYNDNTTMMNCAVEYGSSKGFVLAFASNKTYYFGSSIVVKSNLLIEGNGATMRIHDSANKGCHLFNMENNADLQKNITVRNLTVVGRTNEDQNFGDQAFHVCIEGFTLQNVTIKKFNFGVHTYGRSAAEYTVPEIPNKNWLIENCVIKDTVMGLCCSELDGIIIKDSSITGIFNPPDPESGSVDNQDGVHNLYFSSNCLNIRVTNTTLGIITGDAIHKAYAYPQDNPKFDSSKNHFYTDLSIHNADSALDIGIISQNVMCDNVFATEVEVALQLSGADNCIVSNSHISQTRHSSEMKAFIYAEKACNCWMQNSYVYYNGRHRVTNQYQQGDFLETMFKKNRHRRIFIGPEFKIPNHWFKFTGCEMESTYGANDYYFAEVFDDGFYSPDKSQYGEYLDNCSITINTSSEIFRLLSVNDLFGGITYRNCYLKNLSAGKNQPPFRMWCKYPALPDVLPCDSNTCPVNQTYACAVYVTGKKYPWVRFENNIFDNFMYGINDTSWYLLFKGGKPEKATHNAPLKEKVPNYLNAYFSNGYKFAANGYTHIPKI